MGSCSTSTCCRCGKGPDVCWLGAYSVGGHTICVDCYSSLGEEWGCSDDG